ncbi:MAG: glycosyltransferase family 39 protein [Candidatus Moranbacteria bacterium]|nr:glycosyltransferase family 39 protein [Candidatus Moranbacteria bacterium]
MNIFFSQKRNWFFLAFAVVLIVGIFLRSYEFSDWMHYQLDQARDVLIVDVAHEYGPGELPLQGPRAAGSFLRLGPAHYYLSYLGSLFFGVSPAGASAYVLVFSVLAIPLFYFFARRFFSSWLSLGLTALFSCSLFLVSYSRFLWNPNTLPFFVLLYFYGLLRVVDIAEERRGWWLIIAAGALGIASQLHFIAFVTLPIAGVVILLARRPRIAFRSWFVAIGLVLFLYVPVIINDVKTGGDNAREFFSVAFSRAEDEEGNSHTLVEKVVRNVTEHSLASWLLLTGEQSAELFQTRPIEGQSVFFDIRCDRGCRDGLWLGGVSLGLFMSFFVALALLWMRERDGRRRDFLLVVSVWFGVLFVFFLPMAFDFSPRFFLLFAPLVFVFLGFVLHIVLQSLPKKLGRSFTIGLVSVSLLSNLVYVGVYFSELSRSSWDSTLSIGTDRILKEKIRVTLEQQNAIVDYLSGAYEQEPRPFFVHGQAEYKRAFWQLIEARDLPRESLSLEKIYRDAYYVVIVRTQSDLDAYIKKYLEVFNLVEKKEFGTLTVFLMEAKPEAVTAERKKPRVDSRDPQFSPGVQVRYLWRQVFE